MGKGKMIVREECCGHQSSLVRLILAFVVLQGLTMVIDVELN
jgi:hypothetical protein